MASQEYITAHNPHSTFFLLTCLAIGTVLKVFFLPDSASPFYRRSKHKAKIRAFFLWHLYILFKTCSRKSIPSCWEQQECVTFESWPAPLPTLLSSRPHIMGVLHWACVSKKTGIPSFPSFQSWAPVSPEKGQAARISHFFPLSPLFQSFVPLPPSSHS